MSRRARAGRAAASDRPRPVGDAWSCSAARRSPCCRCCRCTARAALPALVGGLVLGAAVARASGRVRRWSALAVVAVLVVVYVLAGGALAAPARPSAGVVPTPRPSPALARRRGHRGSRCSRSSRRSGRAARCWSRRSCWPSSGRRSPSSVRRCGRARRRGGVGGPRARWSVALAVDVLGTRRPTVAPVVAGVVLVARAAAVGGVARGHLRAAPGGRAGVLVAVVVAGGGVVGGPLVAGRPPRFVLRDEIVPPFDPRDHPSPLSAFREFVKDGRTPTCSRSRACPDGARVRLATMDRVRRRRVERRGRRLRAGLGGVPARRRRRSRPRCAASRARVELEVDDAARRVAADRRVGDSRSTLGDAVDAADLRYNDATGAAVLTGGVPAGPRYDVDVVVPARPTTRRSAARRGVRRRAARRRRACPTRRGHRRGRRARRAATPVQIARAWRPGSPSTASSATGCRRRRPPRRCPVTARTGSRRCSPATSWSATASSTPRRWPSWPGEMGLPARVVLGFVPGRDGTAARRPSRRSRGDDVQAWVEIAFAGHGWVPFDPTPPTEQTPQEETRTTPSEPQPQVVQPPPPPQEPVDAARTTTPSSRRPRTRTPSDDGDAAAAAVAAGRGRRRRPAAGAARPLLVVVGAKARAVGVAAAAPDPVARVVGGWDEVLDAARDLRRPPGPRPAPSRGGHARGRAPGGSPRVCGRSPLGRPRGLRRR